MAEEKKESVPKVSSDGRQFTHLYNSPAPWTGMPGGTEFKSYLLKMRDSGKKKELNESEKKCLEDLEKYISENPEKEESEATFDESVIDWTRLSSNHAVAFYLVFPEWFLSDANKNIQRFVLNKYKECSVSEIVKYAKEKIKKLQASINGKNKVEGEEKDQKSEQDENAKGEKEGETPENEKSSEKEKGKGKSVFKNFADFSRKNNEEYFEDYGKTSGLDENSLTEEVIEKINKIANDNAREM